MIENILPNGFGRLNISEPPKGARLDRYEPGDILIASMGLHLQKTWYADHVGGTNNQMLIVRVRDEWKDRLRSQFLFCALSTPDFFEYSSRYVMGTRRTMNRDKTMDYPIYIPPLAIQDIIMQALWELQRSCIGFHGEYRQRMADWKQMEQGAINLLVGQMLKDKAVRA